MELATYLKDYGKVIDVIRSCETQAHLKTTSRYFDQYLIRWRHMLNRARYNEMVGDFNDRMDIKRIEIEKLQLQHGNSNN
jgi:hypothetical protein